MIELFNMLKYLVKSNINLTMQFDVLCMELIVQNKIF